MQTCNEQYLNRFILFDCEKFNTLLPYFTEILRYLSITASSLGLAWSSNAFKHQYRKTKQNEEDSYLIKFVHWVSRFAEIVPRIILIALLATEYDMIAVYFIAYRLLFGAVYGACERWCDDKEF